MRFNGGIFPVLALICLVCGCASTGAPPGWLPTAEEAPQDPFGSWITVELKKSGPGRYLGGEFLAVGGDSIYVLVGGDPSAGFIQAISKFSVRKATTASFDPETSQASGWVTLGTLSTMSHGFGMSLSAPIWMIVGGAGGAGTHSRTPLNVYPRKSWEELCKYSRFPQGRPPGFYQLGIASHFSMDEAAEKNKDETRQSPKKNNDSWYE